MEKKNYSAFEVAKAVLSKYSELLAKAEHKEEHCEKCEKKECECEDKKVEKCGEIEKKEEKGVHHKAGHLSDGTSMTGEHVQRSKKPSQNQEYHKLAARDQHKKRLEELKQIKPNLPKSEMAKCGEPKKLKKFMDWRKEKKNK
jgi:DUF4097 and DUF4098 domain-containing protein YvlB